MARFEEMFANQSISALHLKDGVIGLQQLEDS